MAIEELIMIISLHEYVMVYDLCALFFFISAINVHNSFLFSNILLNDPVI